MTDELPFQDDVRSRIQAAVAGLGLELCHVDWKPLKSRSVLTLVIDREGGVSLADCERASHTVSDLLDGIPEMTEMPGPYTLEVSSPGLDRQLYTLDDCRRFSGQRVTVRLAEKIEGTAKLKGTLEDVDGDRLTVLDEDRGRRYTVRFGDVRTARLVPDLQNTRHHEANRTERSTR